MRGYGDEMGRAFCSLCGREIAPGETYWACSGTVICEDCLADFAKQALSACRLVRGREDER